MIRNPFAPALLIESVGSLRVVTINRPEAMNAVDKEVHTALANVWRHLSADREARVVIVTGSGNSFSAGGDMDMMVDLQKNPIERMRLIEEARQLFNELIDFSLPVIAAVNGPAVGLGCTLAILCDLVFMAESSYLADPHVSVGLTAGDGGAPFLPLTMSIVKAKEMLFFGGRVHAQEAVSLGLANSTAPNGEVLDLAVAAGQRLAELPPQALQSTKRAINLQIRAASSAVLDYALAAEYQSFDSSEHRSIVQKFVASKN